MLRRLPGLAPLVASALHFDVRRGAHSVGAHVRDAAAYVCWAFVRAYEKDAMAEAAQLLAPALLAAACYDREVRSCFSGSSPVTPCDDLPSFPLAASPTCDLGLSIALVTKRTRISGEERWCHINAGVILGDAMVCR